MRSFFSCLVALFACLPAAAIAGDPCPIDFTFHDAGAPPWLDQATLLDALTTKDSWLGMSFNTSKTPAGVRVTKVSTGSPTAKAGLKVGDVITAANDKALTKFQAFNAVLDAKTPGSVLKLQVTRDGKSDVKTLTLSRQDPVFGALVKHASKQDCAGVSRADTPEAWLTKIRPHLYAKNKRFNCDGAAKALAKDMEPGQIVVMRGSKRVLLANPGHASFCIKAANYDGAKLTPAKTKALFERLTKAYIADRHANP